MSDLYQSYCVLVAVTGAYTHSLLLLGVALVLAHLPGVLARRGVDR